MFDAVSMKWNKKNMMKNRNVLKEKLAVNWPVLTQRSFNIRFQIKFGSHFFLYVFFKYLTFSMFDFHS